MKKIFKFLLIIVIALNSIVFFSNQAKAGKFINLEVSNFYFTTAISGILFDKGDISTRYITHPQKARLLVIDLIARLKPKEALFSNDFVIRYKIKDKRFQENASGLAVSNCLKEKNKQPLTGVFILQEKDSTIRIEPKNKSKKICFSLFFYLENKVKQIELKTFDRKSVKIYLGRKRQYTVLFCDLDNNSFSLKNIDDILKEINKSNCRTIFSCNRFKLNIKKTTILYAVNRKKLAYNIAKIIKKSTKSIPDIEKMNELIPFSSYDLIILFRRKMKGVSL